LVPLPRPEDRLAIPEGTAHALADRLRFFARKGENVSQEGFDALVHLVSVAASRFPLPTTAAESAVRAWLLFALWPRPRPRRKPSGSRGLKRHQGFVPRPR